MNKRLILALLLAGLAVPPAFAVDKDAAATAAAKDPAAMAAVKQAAAADAAIVAAVPQMSLEQILKKNAEARGGSAAWKAVQTLSFTGLMDAGKERKPPGDRVVGDPRLSKPEKRRVRSEMVKAAAEAKTIQLPFTMDLARGRKSRLEVQVHDKTAVQVFDGTNGWKLRPYMGKTTPEPYSPEELKKAAEQQELDGPLLDADAKGNKVELDGVEAVEGAGAYRLKVTEKAGVVRHVWVDAKTFLEVRVDGTHRFDGKDRTLYTYFRDYRTVDGVKIPFVQENMIDGMHESNKIVIEKATVNPKLDPNRFSNPS